ncbi:toll-like receptor 10 [Apodemus sylvaticus]|uniref:toll-like receptor 10 n=1 Tax=Apodemus sylvaticus TaxID=10129 RepID=UPI002241DD22|nr:toll-like receptor 10 [Apodemus sylvaticus]XP_052055114.1 toll-like receptor 10 [Apodemus sylvaticus]
MRLIGSFYTLCNIMMSTEAWAPRPTGGSELISNCSNMALRKVPQDVTPATTILDLSYNLLYQFQSSDFYSFSKLRFLILCHNRIQQLDTRIFDLNKELSYLDLSYNRLKTIIWSSLADLRHLDLSFNDFDTLPACEEIGNLAHLETLGLSGAKIQRSDLQKIAHLRLSTVLLGLRTLSHYEEGSLPVLNTTVLHIVLPMNTNFWLLLCDGMKTSKIVEISNIDGRSQFIRYETPRTLSVENTKASTLILHQVDLLWDDLLDVFQFVWQTSVECFQIRDLTFGGMVNRDHGSFDYSNTAMKTIILENIHFRIFFIPQATIYLFFTLMDLENLTISDAQMPHLLFPSHPQSFQHLNFANNILTDDLFKNPIQLPYLKTLVLRGNKLETLSLVSLFANHTSLLLLDLSQNLLQHRNQEDCMWPDTLILLNLSSNKFDGSVFQCLPKSIQTLDLNNNKIRAVPKEITHLTSLRELSIAFNFLTDLPGCNHFAQLSILNVEMNLIFSPSLDFSQSCQEVKTLSAGRNPFRCTCELRDFIWLEKHSKGLLAGWPDSYACESPLSLKGTLLKDVYLPELACNTTMLIVTIALVMLILGLIVAFCILHFDIRWYLRMLIQCVRTQHRVRKTIREQRKRSVQFHAFISYAAPDSVWVKNELIPNLETEDGPVLLCLPERNFDPDRSTAENIISCTEKSYKSILVLSPDFVQDGWCHYELHLAHHSPFGDSYDDVIPVLLEPIPSYCIPTRFPKLKALLEKKVYLEWPKDRRKRGLFWANLRASINVNLSDTRGRCELQTFTKPSQEFQGSTISLVRTDSF